MWFYILLIVLALFVWWLSRTNRLRHWWRHGADPGGRSIGSAGARSADDVARVGQYRSGLRKRPHD